MKNILRILTLLLVGIFPSLVFANDSAPSLIAKNYSSENSVPKQSQPLLFSVADNDISPNKLYPRYFSAMKKHNYPVVDYKPNSNNSSAAVNETTESMLLKLADNMPPKHIYPEYFSIMKNNDYPAVDYSPQVYVPPRPVNKGCLNLFLGKGHIFYYKGEPTTIFIADPNIADFTMKTPGILYIHPKNIGETNLFGVDKDNQIVFERNIYVKLNVDEIRRTVAQLFPCEHVTIDAINQGVVLRGCVKSASDADKIYRVVEEFIGGGTTGANQNGGTNAGYGSNSKILNFLQVVQPSQVYLKVRVVEISRDISHELGINWQGVYRSARFAGLAAFGSVLNGANFGTISTAKGINVATVLDFLERKGLASVLAEPNLVALSGQSASFLAGGEFPIVVPQALGVQTVSYMQYGVSLSFSPIVVNDDQINLSVQTQVSDLVPNGSVNAGVGINYPTLNTRSANTTVELHSGESFAIAGLLQQNVNAVVNKYPGLSNLPILGPLFRSTRFLNNKTELVIIVTPYLVHPVPDQELVSPLSGVERFYAEHEAACPGKQPCDKVAELLDN